MKYSCIIEFTVPRLRTNSKLIHNILCWNIIQHTIGIRRMDDMGITWKLVIVDEIFLV